MSDSDCDLSNNVFSFQINNNTMVSARGPVSYANTTRVSIRNNLSSSTLLRNDQQRYVGSYAQQSFKRTEPAPMSTMSVYSMKDKSLKSFQNTDSSSSVIAADIVLSIRYEELDDFELYMIFKELKRRIRRRGKLRKKQRLQQCERYFSNNSKASNFSDSDDDGSRNISNFNENMSNCRSTRITPDRQSNISRAVSDRQNRLGGIKHLNDTKSSISFCRSRTMSSDLPANFRNTHRQINPSGTFQKERFKSEVLLPSQRFNRSFASSSNDCIYNRDQDNILFDNTDKQKTDNTQRKRGINIVDNICFPSQKRPKTALPCKNSTETRNHTPKKINNNTTNDFEFAKPANRVSQHSNIKNNKFISKSVAHKPPAIPPAEHLNKQLDITLQHTKNHEQTSNARQSTPDFSMRQSVMKRKEKMQKDMNLDNSTKHRPETIIHNVIEKEKHKTRTLQQVKTRSCLRRDVLQDEVSVPDLIHKIVPPNQTNVRNQTNKTGIQNGDKSYTYDEEICDETVKENMSQKSLQQTKDCMVIVERLPAAWSHSRLGSKPNIDKNDVTKKTVQGCIRSFWDTDYETDTDCQPPNINDHVDKTLKEDPLHNDKVYRFQGDTKLNSNNMTIPLPNANISQSFNNIEGSVKKVNNMTLRLRSHRAPKPKVLNQIKDKNAKCTLIETKNKKQKSKTDIKEAEHVTQQDNNKETKSKINSSKIDQGNEPVKEIPIETRKKQIKPDQKEYMNIQNITNSEKDIEYIKKKKITAKTQKTMNGSRKSSKNSSVKQEKAKISTLKLVQSDNNKSAQEQSITEIQNENINKHKQNKKDGTKVKKVGNKIINTQ